MKYIEHRLRDANRASMEFHAFGRAREDTPAQRNMSRSLKDYVLLLALLAAGWRLVPPKLTPTMSDAVQRKIQECPDASMLGKIYKSLLAAAPDAFTARLEQWHARTAPEPPTPLQRLLASEAANRPGEGLSEQDAGLLNQAMEILEEYGREMKRSGADSAAEGAAASTQAIQRLAVRLANDAGYGPGRCDGHVHSGKGRER